MKGYCKCREIERGVRWREEGENLSKRMTVLQRKTMRGEKKWKETMAGKEREGMIDGEKLEGERSV